MSRSRKDGRRKGGHTNTQGKEYWSRRQPSMSTPGRWTKTITHRLERIEARRIEQSAMQEIDHD